jgi:1-acyl-sn-glycerol-3-phosphate acyltransferase
MVRLRWTSRPVYIVLALSATAGALRSQLGVPQPLLRAAAAAPPRQARLGTAMAEAALLPIDNWAAQEQIGPYIKIGSNKDKIINWYGGIIFAIPALVVGFFWYGAMAVMQPILDRTGWDANRKWYDWTGRVWNQIVLRVTGNYPRVVSGLEHRPKTGQAALICANHASWYDILLAGFFLTCQFKFVSAAELAQLPAVGKQLHGGKHVLIDRGSRKGQLRSVKDSMSWLRKGVSVFAFPEGTRSRDGRLQRFKPGVFAMACKTGVPIVPVSIVNAFAPYPPNALLPIRPATNMEMHFHEPIASTNRTEAQLEALVREAIASKLPADHLPLPTTDDHANEHANERRATPTAKNGHVADEVQRGHAEGGTDGGATATEQQRTQPA